MEAGQLISLENFARDARVLESKATAIHFKAVARMRSHRGVRSRPNAPKKQSLNEIVSVAGCL